MKGEFYNRLKVEYENQRITAYILCKTEEEATTLAQFSNQTCELSSVDSYILNQGTEYDYIVKWYGTDALDLLVELNDQVDLFSTLLCPLPLYSLQFKVKKSLPNAVIPTRAHGSDSGFDLTLIQCVKRLGEVEFYTTGIQIEPPHGYYFDLVPRSSISKMGYMLANNIGIIDQNYRGDVIVPIRKVDIKAESLKLPIKLAQLIPRQWIHMSAVEVNSLDSTNRGEQGFGSTSS